MICADVQSLARAAPETTSTPKISYGDPGSSFDQFLQAVKTDRSVKNETSSTDRMVERKSSREDRQPERTETVDEKPVEQKPVAQKKTDEKPVKETKLDDTAPSEDAQKAEEIDKTLQEAMAAALAVQSAAAQVQQPETQVDTANADAAEAEVAVPAANVAVMQAPQQTVIQLPETEPQPLPDELKQAVQQPNIEVKDFQNLVNTAAQNLENQEAVNQPAVNTAVTESTPKGESSQLKNLDAQEPAVKVVDITAQADDMAQVDTNNQINNVYALANAKTDNLVQPKTLPMIQKISHEVTELARENGKSLRIQIHPENLGKIDLKLMSNSDGLKVVMTTEIPATAKLLETHMDQLQRSLADAGLSLSGMSVNSQGAQGQSANSSLNQSQPGNTKNSLPVFQQDTEATVPVKSQVSTSGLDYRV